MLIFFPVMWQRWCMKAPLISLRLVKIHEKKNLSDMIIIWFFMGSIDKLLTR